MSLFVGPRPATSLDDLSSRRYDSLLCSLGYETRSRAVAEGLEGETHLCAVGFPQGHTDVYSENRHRLEAMGAEVLEMRDRDFEEWVVGWLDAGHQRVAVDISSMSRPRIAATVQALKECSNKKVVVDFLYVPQKYGGPHQAFDATAVIEPVSPALAGWDADAGQPLVILFGLGYEPVRAAGAIDELEPDLAIPFFPYGSDASFIDDVNTANESVFKLPTVETSRPYRLEDPFSCFAELDALISLYGDRGESRPLLLPLGPKIFALVCLLVAVMRDPVTPVWRVSPGNLDEPVDRQPANTLVTLRVSTGPIATAEAWDGDWAEQMDR